MPIEIVCALEPAAVGQALATRLTQSRVELVPPELAAVERALRDRVPDLVVVGSGFLPKHVEGWIGGIRALPEGPEVVLLHDREDPSFRASMIRAGCLAVLNLALPIDELAQTLQALVERRANHLRIAVRAVTPQGRCSLNDFISRSPRMREFLALARQVVGSDSSLLLLGETGTGKERLARALHDEGPRAAGPFVAVNCGALPENLLESELFGHERGAFTGASRTRRGYFEQADGGTVFLDEIGEIPRHLQVKLLRVIEHRRVQRVGGEGSFAVDARVMAATNRDLEADVDAGRFRKDLYYRLAVVSLTLPPLRERAEDVPALFESYVEHFRKLLNRPIYGVEPATMEALKEYSWPGNVRELINVTERAVLLAPGPQIRLADLPRSISALAASPPGEEALPWLRDAGSEPGGWLHQPLREARRQATAAFERSYLTHLLRSTGGRVGAAARRAGINERSLYDLLRQHGIRKEDFRN